MTPPDKTAQAQHSGMGARTQAELAQAQQASVQLTNEVRAAVPADPAARAKQAIAELFARRDGMLTKAAVLREEADELSLQAKAVESELRALGQNPRPRAPRVKKGEVAK